MASCNYITGWVRSSDWTCDHFVFVFVYVIGYAVMIIKYKENKDYAVEHFIKMIIQKLYCELR